LITEKQNKRFYNSDLGTGRGHQTNTAFSHEGIQGKYTKIYSKHKATQVQLHKE
jgi:hypothetical protein